MAESDQRRKDSAAGDGRPAAVGLPQVARVLSQVYGDRMASQEAESFPLQQKLLVCCLLLLTRGGRCKEVLLGKVALTLPPQEPPPPPQLTVRLCARVFSSSTRSTAACVRGGRCRRWARASARPSAASWRAEASWP